MKTADRFQERRQIRIYNIAIIVFFISTIFCSVISRAEEISVSPSIVQYTLPVGTVTVSKAEEEIIVNCTYGDTVLYISDAKQKLWDEIEVINGVAVFDISWITKDYELYIRGDKNTTPGKIEIDAPLVLKAKMGVTESGTSTVNFTLGKSKEAYTNTNNIQWRKGVSGDWKPYMTLNLNNYTTKGATLNFRVQPGTILSGASVGIRGSKVASLKVGKRANAPKVKLDTNKLTINLNKKLEYILSNNTSGVWTKVPDDTKSMPLTQLAAMAGAGGDGYTAPIQAFSLKVRTAASKNKPYSKSTLVAINTQRIAVQGDITIARDSAGGQLTLKNNSNLTEYQYCILDAPGSASTITEKTKWTSVKPSKIVKLKGDISTSKYIVYRMAPVKDNSKTEIDETAIASTVISVQVPM